MPATANEAMIRNQIIKQLSCTKRPDPTPTLRLLMKHGYIRKRERVRVDGVSCWSFKRPFKLHKGTGDSLTATAICAFDDNKSIRAGNPGLYGGGGYEPIFPSLAVAMREQKIHVQQWAFKNLGDGKYKIYDDMYFPIGTSGAKQASVLCSEFEFSNSIE
jgi:hypothetical protein